MPKKTALVSDDLATMVVNHLELVCYVVGLTMSNPNLERSRILLRKLRKNPVTNPGYDIASSTPYPFEFENPRLPR